jgi:hypothetical protein
MDMIKQMREMLVPRGEAPIIRLQIDNAYFKADFITACIDKLEKKMMLAAVGLDDLNELEKLAIYILADSAYIKLDPTDRAANE